MNRIPTKRLFLLTYFFVVGLFPSLGSANMELVSLLTSRLGAHATHAPAVLSERSGPGRPARAAGAARVRRARQRCDLDDGRCRPYRTPPAASSQQGPPAPAG